MRLLIVTQKVDDLDPILGFFVRWVEVIAARVDRVVVIAQSVGSYDLPGNVEVHSLGKETGKSKLTQVVSFWRLVWGRRREYDAVFVHMIPLWVVLGGPLWSLLRIPVTLWYEARGMHWPLRVAMHFVREVYSASPQGMPLSTTKSVITGHGIDTDSFAPSQVPRDPYALVTVGRITEAKNIPVLLDSVANLPKEYALQVVGNPITESDRQLFHALSARVAVGPLQGRVRMGPLKHGDIVPLLQRAQAFLHASETGLDKALLEAMACGCLVISSSRIAAAFLPPPCTTVLEAFPSRVQSLLGLPEQDLEAFRAQLREYVVTRHGLQRLADLLVRRISGLVTR